MFYDLIGAIASLLSTYYFIRQNNKAWAIALLATALNGWLYWQTGIYADMCLESFYF
nr:nicotinamide mononucleotide transporter [Legionella oakridgensis]